MKQWELYWRNVAGRGVWGQACVVCGGKIAGEVVSSTTNGVEM